ncbi:hypothetical protein BY996DRAFT_6468600 [Phakopsora pachyrhizi]|nr:hypothetical protein BY996DRAFT_6468600 [Phakopsora pachyrhizi]
MLQTPMLTHHFLLEEALKSSVVEDLVKGGAESAPGILLNFEDEGVTMGRNGWCHWEEEEKLGGGAHQGQSGWSRITGATDL